MSNIKSQKHVVLAMLYVAMYVYASNRVTVTIICKVKQTALVAGKKKTKTKTDMRAFMQ